MGESKVVQVLQALSFAFLSSYLTVEYLWPIIRRRFQNRNDIRKKLRLEKAISLTKYEEELAHGAVHPDELNITFNDIGGHEEILERLKQVTDLLLSTDSVTNANTMNNPSFLRASRLFKAPTGILLYGPPGCGKTMIAKALAKQSKVRFISLNLATVMDKWVGETEKYIEALFSLARKIAPVIIFVDEIDALTGKRRGEWEREWSSGMKSQLLSQWDGLQSCPSGISKGNIVMLGATNRPQDIDEAFLRRMPLQIKVGLPNCDQRIQILKTFLNDDLGISREEIAGLATELAENSQGFSGSDLYELCRRTVLAVSLKGQSLDRLQFITELDSIKAEQNFCKFYE